jgi:hypothetical protein
MALAALTECAEAAGIEALALSPWLGVFNEDLRAFGIGELWAALRIQLAPQDVVVFMLWATAGMGGTECVATPRSVLALRLSDELLRRAITHPSAAL